MAYSKVPLASWSSDARDAVVAAPDYFVWWYTVKSIGLVAALGLAAYYAGKSRRQG